MLEITEDTEQLLRDERDTWPLNTRIYFPYCKYGGWNYEAVSTTTVPPNADARWCKLW